MHSVILAILVAFGASSPSSPVAVRSIPQQLAKWTVREELRIGSADDSAQALTAVRDVRAGPGGLIYIAQPAEQMIRVFDGSGRPVRRIGREGKGPGEFQRLGSIGFLGDTLYATDQALRRISLFSADGRALHEYMFASPQIGTTPPQIMLPTVPIILLPDGSGLVWPAVAVAWLAAGLDRIPIFRLHADATTVDTIARIEYEVPNAVLEVQGRRMGVAKPFPDAPIHGALADGTGILVVHRRIAGRRGQATFSVAKVSVTGDTVFRRELTYQPLPVTDGLVTEAVERIHERLARRATPPSASQIRTSLRDDDHIPQFLPPVTETSSGTDGTIWLKREIGEGPTAEWLVLGPNGAPVATVELGRNQSVAAVSGNTLFVTELDELDVPYVIRYRIVK